MSGDFTQFNVSTDTPIRDVMARIDASGRYSLALLVDAAGCFLDTFTDGDVRRSILAGVRLTAPARELLVMKATTPHPEPLTAPEGTPLEDLLRMMQATGIRQIPLLDAARKVTDIVLLRDLLPKARLELQAVIMAGGKGTRLRPLTEDVPKPMLTVGGRPLMERIVEQLQKTGIRNVSVTTHYKPEKIVEHFGTGSAFGVDINYVNEDQAMGTGGALGLMPAPSGPMLVINGDILTDVNFQALLAYHQEHEAAMTVAVRQYVFQVPYGVIECEQEYVRQLKEKPEVRFFVNAGVYLIEPAVYEFVPRGQRFDMTDLIQKLLDGGRTVVSYPILEYWLDIGQHADYAKAQEDAVSGACRPAKA